MPLARLRLALALLSLALAARAGTALAAWGPDGNPLSLAQGAQTSPVLVTDGVGGAFAAWVDSREGNISNVFAQRVTSDGTRAPGWLADGNTVPDNYCFKNALSMAPDGVGGALLAWSDNLCDPDRNIRAMRMTAAGVSAPGWPQDGVDICIAPGNQDAPVVCTDGAGGAFVAWEDWRGGSSMIYAQHVAPSGVLASGWPANGLLVCAAGDAQSLAALASDGAGGAFVVWQDRRAGAGDIYLERLSPAGTLVSGWPAAGLAVCAAADHQGGPALLEDGAGGAFVTWSDHRGGNDDIYAARVDGTGALAPGWIVDGTPVCLATADQRKPVLAADGAGGILLAWQDHRGGTYDIYAQRLDGSGARAAGWSADGVALCAAAGDQLAPQIASASAGGAFVAWQDARSGSAHIYAQHVTGAGTIAPGWGADGAPLCTATGSQLNPRIAVDGAGGAFVAWVDSRTANATAPDLYAQRLLDAGPISTQPSGLVASHREGQTFLTWTAPLGTGWTYRVFASAGPINQASDLAGATFLGAVGDSTWCDRRLSLLTGQTYAYRTDSATAAIAPDHGLFVVTPVTAGASYYAVTAQLAGFPDQPSVIPGVNALAAPVSEWPEAPRPVYQRTITVGPFITPAIYTLWTSNRDAPLFPAMANRPGVAFDCAVVRGGTPPSNALLVNFHARQGNFLQGVYSTGAPGEWVLSLDDPLATQDSDTFWYGTHEDYDPTLELNPVRTTGRVCDYTLRRTLHTLRWARRNFQVDTARVYTFGFSMGAIGGFLLALHEPGLVAALIDVVGKTDFSFTTDPNPASLFNPGGGLRVVSDRLWGPVDADLPTSEGGTIYEQLSGPWLVGRLGVTAAPPIISFAGRNDFAMGWAEKIPFYHAMRDARQGGTFFWDMRDHVGSALAAWAPAVDLGALYRFRTDRSFPALSNGSADEDPGNGTVADGDSVGTINGHLEWDTAILDEPARWAVTLRLRDLTTLWGPAPAPDSATVDVTPRRLQSFAVERDSAYDFIVTRLPDGAVVQQGSVVADSLPLLTVPGVKVYRGGSLLRIQAPDTDTLAVTAVEDVRARPGPIEIALTPNPATGAPIVRVSWPRTGFARVDLFDVGGRLVHEVYRGPGTGTLALRLDPRGLAGGLYFVVATQGGERVMKRLVVLR